MTEVKRFKCFTCKTIIREEELRIDPTAKKGHRCPACGEEILFDMCPLDHCHCAHDVVEALAYCPECGKPMCPICGCHDVVTISRVTGYLADISGFNEGKKQEVRDRKRYTI